MGWTEIQTLKKAVWVFCLLLTGGMILSAQAADLPSVVVTGFYPGDRAMWLHIFEKREPLVTLPSKPGVLIVPHHLILPSWVTTAYSRASEARSDRRPDRIILFSPDHFEAGPTSLTIPGDRTGFLLPDGKELPLDRRLGEQLQSEGVVSRGDEMFLAEHGVFVHVPFIGHFFPDVPVLIVTVKPGTPRQELDQFLSALDRSGGWFADTLVIASVDFSHYQVEELCEIHDGITEATLISRDYDNLFNVEVDSPESLYLAMKLGEKGGYGRFFKMARTSSQMLYERRLLETTSHLYCAFLPGDPVPSRSFGILIPPPMPEGSPPGLLTEWTFDRYGQRNAARPVYNSYQGLSGKEERTLMGFDAYPFGLAPGEPATVEQNGLKVVFQACQARSFDPQDILALIADNRNGTDILYLDCRLETAPDKKELSAFMDLPSGADSSPFPVIIRLTWPGAPWSVTPFGAGFLITDSSTIPPDGNRRRLTAVVFKNGKLTSRDFPVVYKNGLPVLDFGLPPEVWNDY